MEGHRDIVMAVTFMPDGQSLASGSLDGTVRLWDTQTGILQHSLKASNDSIIAVAFSPDGKTLASAGGDKTVKLWDVSGLRPPTAVAPPPQPE